MQSFRRRVCRRTEPRGCPREDGPKTSPAKPLWHCVKVVVLWDVIEGTPRLMHAASSRLQRAVTMGVGARRPLPPRLCWLLAACVLLWLFLPVTGAYARPVYWLFGTRVHPYSPLQEIMASLTGIWLAMGPGTWRRRVLAAALGIFYLVSAGPVVRAIDAALRSDRWYTLRWGSIDTLLLLVSIQCLVVALLLLAFRRFGVRLCRLEQNDFEHQTPVARFSIRTVVGIMLAIAALAVLVPAYQAGLLPGWAIHMLPGIGIGAAAVWAAFERGPALPRIAVLVVMALGLAMVPHYAFGRFSLYGSVAAVVQGLAISGVLLIVRGCGYRLAHNGAVSALTRPGNEVMPRDESTREQPQKRGKWQFSLRTLLGLFLVAALLGYYVRCLATPEEVLPYTFRADGENALFSTERFDIVVEGVTARGTGTGYLTLSGPTSSNANIFPRPDLCIRARRPYLSSRLQLEINSVEFLITAGGKAIVVDGREYRTEEKIAFVIAPDGRVRTVPHEEARRAVAICEPPARATQP